MTVDLEGHDASGRDDRWYLTDEREFLRRSLDDADREHEAGDLSDEDHAVLMARDSTRLVEVEVELATLDPAPPESAESADSAALVEPPPSAVVLERVPMPWWRRLAIAAACGLIVVGVVILVVHYVQARQPGQASSGSVSVSQAQHIEQQLQEALAANNKGDKGGALLLYDAVLSEDPSNPAALAAAGYLQWNLGSASHVASLVRIGRAEIETAVNDAPTYYQAHLFYGLVLENQDHNDAAAVTQFNDFLADGPPSAELAQVAPLVAPAYRATGRPVPSDFGSAG
jgi:hypothetical protein